MSAPATSLEWFFDRRQEANRQALKNHQHDPDWVNACGVMDASLSSRTAYRNLLFDNAYNLTGVIGWDQAQTAPLERLAISPEFGTSPAGLKERNAEIWRKRGN